jgi:chromosome segregation ATPase
MATTERPGLLSLATIGSDLAADLATNLAGADVVSTTGVKQAEVEVGQLQWNLLREQIASVSRDLSAARQDITSLRLVGSQYEVQNAELSRHVRETVAQLRTELMEVQAAELMRQRHETDAQLRADLSVQFLELSRQVEVTISSALVQRTRAVQERMVQDISIMEERISKTFASNEEFASIQHLQDVQAQLEAKSQGLEDLILEVRAMKSDFDTQCMNYVVRQNFDDLVSEVSSELQDINKRHAALEENAKVGLKSLDENVRIALKSATEEIGLQIVQLSQSVSSQMTDVEELATRLVGDERAAREEHADGLKVELQGSLTSLERLQLEFSDHTSDLKQFKEDHGNLMDRERASHAERHSQLVESLEEARRAWKDELGKIAEKHTADHAMIRDHVSKVVTEERELREAAHSAHKALLQGDLETVRKELSEHKAGAEEAHASLHTLLVEERGAREKAHKNTHAALGEKMEDIERRIRDSASEISTNSNLRDGAVGSLEMKLMSKIALISDEHGSKHEQLKGSTLAKMEGIDTNIAAQMAKMSEEHKQAIDELHAKHADLGKCWSDTARIILESMPRLMAWYRLLTSVCKTWFHHAPLRLMGNSQEFRNKSIAN